jgi:hypothetical protein
VHALLCAHAPDARRRDRGVQRARAGGGEGDHPACTSETRKAGDTPPTGEALPLPCAGGLAPKRFSARAEGEALSPYAPSLPALGQAGARFRRGRAAAGDSCERERDRMAETTGSVSAASSARPAVRHGLRVRPERGKTGKRERGWLPAEWQRAREAGWCGPPGGKHQKPRPAVTPGGASGEGAKPRGRRLRESCGGRDGPRRRSRWAGSGRRG